MKCIRADAHLFITSKFQSGVQLGFREMRTFFFQVMAVLRDLYHRDGRFVRTGCHPVETPDSTEISMRPDLKSVVFHEIC